MTVQALIAKMVRRIDPRSKAGIEITDATVGTVDGRRFTKQRHADILNEARMLLLAEARKVMSQEKLSKEFGGSVVPNTSVTFTSGVASVPAGWVRSISLIDSATPPNPVIILDYTLEQAVKSVKNKHYIESATKRFVFEDGQFLRSPSGSAYLTNGAYKLTYFGITNWTLANVTAGTAVETINPDYAETILLELAEAIALAQGTSDPAAVARKLLGAK